MTIPPRHQRQRFDRLLSPGAGPDEIVVDKALGPFDAASRAASLKWGWERLPDLVSVETAAKFGSALAKLNAAINAGDASEVAARVGVCLRGFAAMDAEAEATGAPKADPAIIEYEFEGFRFGIMKDDGFWQAAKAANPDMLIYSLREVAIALQSQSPIIGAVMKSFSKSKIKVAEEIKPVNYDLGGDAIPF